MKCFYCVAEQVAAQKYDCVNEDRCNAITQYHGTLVCAVHAHKEKELERDKARDARNHNKRIVREYLAESVARRGK